MTPLDQDIASNISASKMQRALVYMTPLERRIQILIDAGYPEDKAEITALETMGKEKCEQ